MRLSSSFAPIACLLLAAGCDTQTTGSSQPNATGTAKSANQTSASTGKIDRTHKGAAMPGDSFTAPDGRPTTLAAFKGRPVLVNLWATWCGPCVKEMPALDRLAARTNGKLRVLTVNQDFAQAAGGQADPVATWWAKAKLKNLRAYRDDRNNLGFAYGGGQLPTTVLYDADGREVWRVTGDIDWDGAAADALLAERVG